MEENKHTRGQEVTLETLPPNSTITKSIACPHHDGGRHAERRRHLSCVNGRGKTAALHVWPVQGVRGLVQGLQPESFGVLLSGRLSGTPLLWPRDAGRTGEAGERRLPPATSVGGAPASLLTARSRFVRAGPTARASGFERCSCS